MRNKCNDCGAPRQNDDDLHCPFCMERDALKSENEELRAIYDRIMDKESACNNPWCDTVIDQLKSQNAQLAARVKEMLLIVEAAWMDYHSAFAMPGSGYNNKAQSLAASLIGRGWGADLKFTEWKRKLEADLRDES